MLRKMFRNKKVDELECLVLDLLKRVKELEASNERRANKGYTNRKSFNKPQKLATV